MLRLRVLRRSVQVGPTLTVWADPDAADWMRDHLVTSIRREGWPPSRIGEFVMEIRADGRLLHTFAATERER